MGSSLAAGDKNQAMLDQEHTWPHNNTRNSRVKTTPKIVYEIIDMLGVAQAQSKISSMQVSYIFLSRIDAILQHIGGDAENITKQVANKIEIPQDLIDIHIKWTALIRQHEYLPGILNDSLSQLKRWKSPLATGVQMKYLWKEGLKRKLHPVINNVTQYQMFMRYFCIRTYGKDVKEFTKS